MTPFDKIAFRPVSKPQIGDQPAERVKAVDRVRFSFPTKGAAVTLNISDFTSGQAMIDAAQEWAARQ